MAIKIGIENKVECYKLEDSDYVHNWTRKNGKSLKTGDKFLGGIIDSITKNDCFSSFIKLVFENGETKTVLASKIN